MLKRTLLAAASLLLVVSIAWAAGVPNLITDRATKVKQMDLSNVPHNVPWVTPDWTKMTVGDIYELRVNAFSNHQAYLFIQAKDGGGNYGGSIEKIMALREYQKSAITSCPTATLVLGDGENLWGSQIMIYQSFNIFVPMPSGDGFSACTIK